MWKASLQTRLDRWDRAAATVIAACRRDADLTQTQVAEALGVGRNVIAQIEGGRRPLKYSEVMVLAPVLKLKPETLVGKIIKWV